MKSWIDSANDRAPIAQRGHSKQKRSDLRLVGLGLVVAVDGGVPLVSHAYPGNKPDVTQFPAMIDQLLARYQAVTAAAGVPAAAADMTVVFDAGQNSEDNFAHLARSGLAGPALLSYLTWETAKIRSTQSATGILYVDFFTVVVGEMLAKYIVLATRVPV